ncbi:hypothetical protein LASUN_01060 [Lentilactobacillus sunkii]|uniref:DUF917 domain-containing protein n=1 Tax=Lentilactobacillus sunkii TaxID=481719 RepID=A0A1E7XJ43_9LACO|nr:DUF917 domain-containing protein [Lentilactobacillus sunkii]OFA13107.1 hypothetical protein LASUN_01060 [Lentilactobacillus sunkii]
MKEITVNDVPKIGMGATVLGTGGGGAPHSTTLIAQQAIKENGPVHLIDVSELNDEDLVVPIGGIGAPTVGEEKIEGKDDYIRPVEMVQKVMHQKVQAVIPIEVGGGNSLIPIAAAAKLHVPVVDADGMGRAFPEIQMQTYFLAGYNPNMIALSDALGNESLVFPKDGTWGEKISRNITTTLGGSASFSDNIFPGKVVKKVGIQGTLSLAWKIGDILLNPMKEKNALDDIAHQLHGLKLFSGKVMEVNRRVADGFTKGKAIIAGLNQYEDQQAELFFQNELLIAKVDGNYVATTPDLIACLDEDTNYPITTSTIKFGNRINVVAFKADDKWRTDRGIEVAGPRYFGYDVDYIPVEQRIMEEG